MRGGKVKSRDCALVQSDLVRAVNNLLARALNHQCALAKPEYLCARGSNWDGRLAHTASRQGARSASHSWLCRLNKMRSRIFRRRVTLSRALRAHSPELCLKAAKQPRAQRA